LKQTVDEESRPSAVFDSVESALDAAGTQHHANDQRVHILLAGQARAHQAFAGCDQQV
jgi:hypothetical protein